MGSRARLTLKCVFSQGQKPTIVKRVLNWGTLAEIIKLAFTLSNKMLEVELYLEQRTEPKRGTEKLIILAEVYEDIEEILRLELVSEIVCTASKTQQGHHHHRLSWMGEKNSPRL